VVLIGLIVWLRPAPVAPSVGLPDTVSTAQIQPVIEQRCVMCHNAALPSKGVRLDSISEIDRHAQAIYQQVVVTRQMPMNNATGITDDERQRFARWALAGR
jgi:uncharacterized membrane protein